MKVDANYYHITYKNRIDNGYPGSFTSLFQGATAAYSDILTFNPTPEQIQNARQLGTSGLGMFVSRVGPYALPPGMDENSTEVILDNRFRNNASTTQRGVDLDTSYAFGVGQTDVALSLAGQYIIESKRRVTSSAPEVNALNDVYLPVDLKLRGGVALNRQQLAMGLFVNYADNYHDSSNPNDPHVSSWTTVDLNIGYRFAPSLWPEGETLLAFNVQNIFDRDPPFVVNSINTGYDPTNATALGRFVSMSLTHQW